MRTIQWFPGHMTKAMRMMEQNLRVVDGIIYVLDARCPAASFNFKLKKMMGSKPILYVFNKCDLADERSDVLLKILQKKGCAAISLNAANSTSRRNILGAIENLIKEKRERALEKGQTKSFRFMVCGVPNTGKSTLINLLSGIKRTQTGDKAGVTKGKQWVRLESFELLDTPGTMPPAFDNQYLAAHLAFVGSINDDILDLDDIALLLLKELGEKYPKRLISRYEIEIGEPLEMLEGVCRRRGLMLRGGEYDYDRAIRAVIDDFRKGKLGRITLDTPQDMENTKF